MAKTKVELESLKKEFEDVVSKLKQIDSEELEFVTGGHTTAHDHNIMLGSNKDINNLGVSYQGESDDLNGKFIG